MCEREVVIANCKCTVDFACSSTFILLSPTTLGWHFSNSTFPNNTHSTTDHMPNYQSEGRVLSPCVLRSTNAYRLHYCDNIFMSDSVLQSLNRLCTKYRVILSQLHNAPRSDVGLLCSRAARSYAAHLRYLMTLYSTYVANSIFIKMILSRKSLLVLYRNVL